MAEPKGLYAAFAAAFPEIEGASKDRTNPAFKSKYADLSSVVEAIKPALAKHGLVFAQHTHDAQAGVCVETILYHASGESLSFGKLFVPAGKQDAQGFGSALTYARRYSLMTAFGVAPEDDDGNAASKSPPRADPLPAKLATDAQTALIMTLAPVKGKTIQGICEAYGVSALDELTEAKAAAVITRLNTTETVSA